MGTLPDFLPGYQTLADAQVRQQFEKQWRSRLPADVGLTALEMMEQAGKGKIKGMFIMGENPVANFPQPGLVKEALASLDFLAVTDMFLTETAKLASVVLPAASFAEKEGTVTNFEGRVQRIRKVIEPFGGSLPDSAIVLRLAEEMGAPMSYSSEQQIMDEIEKLVPFYQNLSYADLEKEGLDWADTESGRLGTRRLHKGLFPDGFGKFSPVKHTPPKGVSRDGYPLTLLVGSIRHHFGAGSRSSRASRLIRFYPGAAIEISEPDARGLGIKDGDKVKVTSAKGEILTTATIGDTLSPGLLFMPITLLDSHVYELFDTVLDEQAKAPALKSCAVRLERTDNG
jgi:predicted molibdopterin-dependent oxidoreductase YjgC